MERILFDWHYSNITLPEKSEDIVLVLAGERTFSELGSWPWSRYNHAKLLGRMGLSKTILLDIIMPEESSPEDDALLAKVVAVMGNVVVAGHISVEHGENYLIRPYPAMYEAAAEFGVTNINKDIDGLLRAHVPFRLSDHGPVASLPLAGAAQLSQSVPKVLNEEDPTLLVGERLVPLTEDGQVWIQFSEGKFARYEYYDVMNGTISPEVFKDKIVVVGIAASGASDFHMVPDFPGARVMTGAEYNARVLMTLLWGKIPVRVSFWAGAMCCLLAGLLGGLIGKMRPVFGYAGLGIALLSVVCLSQYVFVVSSIWLDVVSPAIAMVFTFSIVHVLRYVFMHRDWEVQSYSIGGIANIDSDVVNSFEEFPDYLEAVWGKLGLLTGVQIVKTSIGEDELGHDFLPEGTSLKICHPGPENKKFGMAVPVSGEFGARQFVLMGWDKNIEERTLKTLSAVVLSNAWFFNSLKEAGKRKNVLLKSIHAIFRALDFRDPVTGGHSNRVSALSLEIMQHMMMRGTLTQEQIHLVEDVYLGALVHDVGKIGISDSILLKEGKLSEKEFMEIKSHPSIGHNIMQAAGLPKAARLVLIQHHERVDGTGYPHQLVGDEISFGARVVAVADVYDALTHDRPYREGWTSGEACAYIKSKSSIFFDAKIVDAFMEMKDV